jgi:phytoene synthase
MNGSLHSERLSPALTATADSVLASKGRSFHWARHLLGVTHAARATRLYRLCRYIDDMADEGDSVLQAQQALAVVAASLRSGRTNDPILQDGLALMHECGIEADILLDLVAGVESDLQLVRMQSLDALLRYGYQVAGTVGLMMCKVLDTHDSEAFAHAVDLGIAMQLTNICRDISADAAIGRRYLPASMVGDLMPAQLLQADAKMRAALQTCVVELLDCADTYYQSGELGLSYLPLRARAGMLVAARVYRGIGLQLRMRPLFCGDERAVVPTWRKAVITSQALLSVPFMASFWSRPAQHDAGLHDALTNSPSLQTAACWRHAR